LIAFQATKRTNKEEKMNRRKLLVVMVLLLLVSLLAVACAKPAPVPAPAPPPAPAPTATPQPSLPEVRWTYVNSETTREEWNVAITVVLPDNVRARTSGKFNIVLYLAAEMGISREALPKAVSIHAIDMVSNPNGTMGGIYPQVNVYGLPFLVGQDVIADGKKIESAIHKITEREFSKQGVSQGAFFAQTPVQLISKKPIEDLSDLKGLKVRAWDENTSAIVKNLKGEPVLLPISETYPAMQRGVVDAVLTGVPGMLTQSLQEQAKKLYIINLAPAFIYILYNNDSYKALPKEYQDILLDEFKLLEKRAVEAQPVANKKSVDQMVAAGVELITPPADQMQRVRTQVKPLWETWAAAGPLNKEAYDAVMKAFGY
jgi:TRAP-type C4-dicarboxylate transport system substrate-binding protein